MAKKQSFGERINKLELLVAAAPFFVLVLLVKKYGVSVPFTDQWSMVPLFEKVNEHKLHFSDLWAQHNEHRMLFPITILLILAFMTKWSIKAEIALNLLTAAFSFLAIYLIIHRTSYSKYARLLTVGMASLLFFSPDQWESWLLGYQFSWFLCVSAALWSFYILSRVKSEDKISILLIVAALVGYIGTYSLGSGPLIWFAGMLILLLNDAKKRQYIFWAVNGIIGIGLYYYHYVEPVGHPSLSLFYRQPIQFIDFFSALIGRPFAAIPYAAELSGFMFLTLGLLVFLILLFKRLTREYSIWLGLALFGLLASLITSISRQGFGISGALASRYTAFATIYIIALLAITIGLLTKPGFILSNKLKASSVVLSIALILIPVISTTYVNGVQGMQNDSANFKNIRACTHQVNPTDACMIAAYPVLSEEQQYLQYVKQKGWAGY